MTLLLKNKEGKSGNLEVICNVGCVVQCWRLVIGRVGRVVSAPGREEHQGAPGRRRGGCSAAGRGALLRQNFAVFLVNCILSRCDNMSHASRRGNGTDQMGAFWELSLPQRGWERLGRVIQSLERGAVTRHQIQLRRTLKNTTISWSPNVWRKRLPGLNSKRHTCTLGTNLVIFILIQFLWDFSSIWLDNRLCCEVTIIFKRPTPELERKESYAHSVKHSTLVFTRDIRGALMRRSEVIQIFVVLGSQSDF